MSGVPGEGNAELVPKANITRAEVAVIVGAAAAKVEFIKNINFEYILRNEEPFPLVNQRRGSLI